MILFRLCILRTRKKNRSSTILGNPCLLSPAVSLNAEAEDGTARGKRNLPLLSVAPAPLEVEARQERANSRVVCSPIASLEPIHCQCDLSIILTEPFHWHVTIFELPGRPLRCESTASRRVWIFDNISIPTLTTVDNASDDNIFVFIASSIYGPDLFSTTWYLS